ncbi:hypothetical protein JCM10908_002783 [Rhodotorula pacifica]|uniref:uncharacterized protein n=1 Tax=Rhodotorula pacifica TaxID=1495444 RepID=UPI003174185D
MDQRPHPRPRPPRLSSSTSNGDKNTGGTSTPLTALPITPRVRLRRARERASFDGSATGGTPLTPLAQLGHSTAHKHTPSEPVATWESTKPVSTSQAIPRTTERDELLDSRSVEPTSSLPEPAAADLAVPVAQASRNREISVSRSGPGFSSTPAATATTSASLPATQVPPALVPADAHRDAVSTFVSTVSAPADGVLHVTGATNAAYGSLTRGDLEYLLVEADRVIREKEQELATFTAAGQDLLDEYRRLRREHEALAPSTSRSAPSPASSPMRPRYRGNALPSDQSPSNSHLVDGTGAGISVTPAAAAAMPTPGASPPSFRYQDKSASISTASRSGSAPSSRILFSPASQAKETAMLSQANYALTLQLSEVQAETDAAEREGRKKLRKLERELQSLRADLERVEQRNAILETQAELAKNKEGHGLRSSRAQRVEPGRVMASPVTPKKSTESPFRHSPSATREECGEDSPLGSKSRERAGQSMSLGKSQELDRPALLFPQLPRFSPPPGASSSISADLLPRSVHRTVSTSSLVPLPLPIHLDPSLEKQQDELVDQLMAKIDELQDTNHTFLAEREHMFHRLTEAQDEVYEWKERCEELEDENQQHRLIGWRNAVDETSHGWLGREELDDIATAGVVDDPMRTHDSLHLFSELQQGGTDHLSQGSSSTGTSPRNAGGTTQQTTSAMPAPRSLGDELELDCTSPARHDDCRLLRGTSSSLVLRNATNGSSHAQDEQNALDWPCNDLAETTQDDLLPTGSLRYSGYPTADKYEELEQAAAALEPEWADAHLPKAHLSRMTVLHEAKLRVSGARTHNGARVTSRRARKPLALITKLVSEAAEQDASPVYVKANDRVQASAGTHRRRRALRRLSIEASVRKSGQEMVLRRESTDSDSASDGSSSWSDFDSLEHSLRRHSDYLPVGRLTRLRPGTLAGRAVNTASQHVMTLFTWLRFMILLSTAVVFAIWQGPQKTLGAATDRERRRRLQ